MPKYLICKLIKSALKPKCMVIADTPESAFSVYRQQYNLQGVNGVVLFHLQRSYMLQKLNMTIMAKYKPELPTYFSKGFQNKIIKLREKFPNLGYDTLVK